MKTRHEKRSRSTPFASQPGFGALPTRRRTWLIALAIGALLAALASILVQRPAVLPLPAAPTHYLEDQAGLLSPGFAAAKDQYIQHLSRTTRIAQINIVILSGTPIGELEDFTIRAATEWKVGAGDADNGLILFIFRDQRMVRLEVGYGLEAVITDAVARRLLAEQLVPAFARGQFEQGIEDFLDVLDKTLESSEAANRRAAPYAAMLPFVLNVLHNSPRIGRQAWRTFLAEDSEGRIVLSLFGVVLLTLLARALLGIAAGIPALLMLPWRLYSSATLRTVRRSTVVEQFAPRNFFARPPPIMASLFREFQLGAIANSIYLLAAIVVGIAFLFVGSSILIGGLGHFGGGGASLPWPAL